MAAGGDSAGRPDEAVARLLEAWQGEIEARAVYTILAERMRHPRRTQVIRELPTPRTELSIAMGYR